MLEMETRGARFVRFSEKQVMGRHFAEAALFRVAFAIERALGEAAHR